MQVTHEMLLEAYGRISTVSYYHIFLILVVLDILLGNIKGFVTKKYDSSIGMKGLLKHLCVVTLILLVCPYLWLLGYAEIATSMILLISFNYLMSILENLEKMGISEIEFLRPLFEKLRPRFKQMQETPEKTADEILEKVQKGDKKHGN